ncbi:SitI3 family protein [Kitasatospora sp. NPDC004272]
MSVDHQIYLNTDEPVDRVASKISRLLWEKGLISSHLDADRLLRGGGARMKCGALVVVSPYDATPFDLIEENFGVSPTVQVFISPKREAPFFPQEDDIVALAAALLEETSNDMVLSYNFETAWLIRRSAELILHERPSLWPENRLALIKGPYRRESHQL